MDLINGKPSIVGLCGRAQAGNDTAALRFKVHGYTRVAFADPLRAAVALLTGWKLASLEDPVFKNTFDPYWGCTPRQMLQRFGTEVGRSLDPDFWVKAWKVRVAKTTGTIVVTDVRFGNEAAAIHDMGGVLICVRNERAEAVPAEHESEKYALELPANGSLDNNGTVEELWKQVDHVVLQDAEAAARFAALR